MKKNIATSLLAGTLVLAQAAPAFAAADTAGHWAQDALNTWQNYGVIKGDENGNLMPDSGITRGEMAVMLDRVMAYQLKSQNTFSDLDQSWYTDAILGANAAGIIMGMGDGTVQPGASITRQETAVMFARVLSLDTQSAPDAGFLDQASIPDWAVGAVNAMAAAGYMQGSNGMFRPADTITRAEVVTILDNIFNANYNTSGEYTGDVDGSAVISADAVTLKDMHITGDLIVAEGVGEGHVELDNVTVDGRLLVRGGGANSIVIKGDSKITQVIIARQEGKVRVAVEDGAQVSVVVVEEGSDDVKLEGTLGTVSIEGSDAAVEITGKVDTVDVTESADNTSVTVSKGSTVSTLTTSAENATLTVAGKVEAVTVTESAEGTAVKTESGAKIDSVTTAGANTTVEGNGTVSKVEAAEGATGTTVTTNGTKVENNSTESVTTGNGSIDAGESGTTTKPSTGGGSSSGGGSTVEDTSVEQLVKTAQDAGSYKYDGYEYVGSFESKVDGAAVTISARYTQEQFDLKGAMNDMARYLGALHRVESSAVKSITFNGTVYTWASNPTLAGSNWVKDASAAVEDGNTLVSAIVDYYQKDQSAPLTMTLKGTGSAAVTLTFSFEITPVVEDTTVEQLVTTAQNAGSYKYDDYTYVGSFESKVDGANVTISAEYTKEQFDLEGAMNDMARYLGALHRVESSAVKSITFNNTVYTWNESLALKGSNWAAEDGTTLVSAIVKFYGEHPSSSIAMTLKGTGSAAVTLTFSFEITQEQPTVTELTGSMAAQSGESFTTIGTDFVLDLDNEIPAEVSDKVFTQEQVAALGGSGDYRSLTLYVKVNGQLPTFTSIKQKYMTADGQLATMKAKTNTKDWAYDAQANTLNGETGRYGVKDGNSYLKLALYSFYNAGSGWDLISDNAAKQVLEFYNGEDLVATLTVDSPLNGYTVAAPVVDTATVSSADELAAALSNESITTINLSSSFEAASEIVVGRPVTINGNSNTITSKNASENAQQSAGILVASDGVTLRNLTVSGPNNTPSGWDSGEYGIKVFNANDVTLENVTVTAANAGIQVNSSKVTLAGTITVSGNEFGGIEVCKSSEEGMQAGKLNLNGATVVCSDSAVPAIWIDGTTAEAGVVTGADSLYTSNTGSQIYYFTNVPASAQAQIGQTLYASLDDALSAVKTGETLTLHADATVSPSTLQNAVTGKTVTIDVNGNALTVSGTSTSVVLEKSGDAATALTIKNGTLNLNNHTGANAAINIKTDSSIVLEDLTVNSTATVLYPQGDAASVTVDNCDITTSGAYAIATNAATVDNYNVVISVSGGSITMEAADNDSAALCLNVAGTMNVTGTAIKGQRQAVIVRAGTATFTGCNISSNSTPLSWVNESMYTGTWGSGNEVPYGALIVGNQTTSTYAADANVTLTDCEISATGTSEQSDVFKFFAVYAIRQNNSFNTVINTTGTEVITGTVEKLGENVSITGLTVTGEETEVTEAV